MLLASELEPVTPGIFLWRFYDPSLKADLSSTAVATDSGTYLIDPIALALEAMAAFGRVAGVIITNENHIRASSEFAARFEVPIFSAMSDPFAPGLMPVRIDGAAPGELAIYCDADGGAMFIGDALINFEPYGFTFLPAKYASNARLMRRSLARLLDYSFERMFFAHGMPILSGARERLELLLKEHR